nr:retrovirus-related Pol polyprotein from transposon TNT 1-94 [Tanacetum cinerariifolium]
MFAKQPNVEILPKIGLDNTKTRRPQLRSNTKNGRVPSVSNSSRRKNKEAKVEEHHRNLLLSKKNKHISSACNNSKIDSQDVISKPKVSKPNNVGTHESLATPKPQKPRFLLRWSPTGKMFDPAGKLVAPSNSESHVDCSNSDNGCTSNAMKPKIKRFPNSTSLLGRNLEGVDLLKGDRSTNLYTINLHEMASASPICLMAHASSTKITVLLQSPVIIIRTDNGTEFKNQVLKVYFDSVGISHQMYSVRTPQQNGVVERRNQTLVEAARTMLIFSRASLFLWAEAIATACFTQNCSIIHRRFNKTPYELINGRKPDISFLHLFGALCYPKNDREDIGKLGAKGDIGFFIGYSADSCAYRIYNHRTKKIMETMNVSFDELSVMAFEQRSLKLELQSMTSRQISSELDLTYAPSTITKQQPTEGELDLLFETMYDDYFGGQPSTTVENVSPAQEPQVRQTSTASTTIADNVPIPTNSSSHETNILIT